MKFDAVVANPPYMGLISYAIGCMMGRYSLDEPGLIYAHAGNVGFDATRYKTFPADADGIVPITDELWFEDDAANRVREFLRAVWGADTLDENMAWLAESLGTKASETPDETIRRYLADKFFKDHLQTYKKRPIYWLFSSGKQGAFQALVYLHRYHEGTLARLRAEYVVPLTGKMQARIEMLEKDAAAASSTAARNKLNKQIEKLRKKHVELLAYDEKLRHYADMRISLDLDDGVKVNYGKFGDLLAEVKAVTGGAGFKCGKLVLKQAVTREQISKLLATGRTDLLKGFTSMRDQHLFAAHLMWNALDGLVEFELESEAEKHTPRFKPGGEKKSTLFKRASGVDVVAAVTQLREDPPGRDASGKKKLIRLLGNSDCPHALLLWAAVEGDREMKATVAANDSSPRDVLGVLMADADEAAWCVFAILERTEVVQAFVLDTFGENHSFSHCRSVEELFFEPSESESRLRWKVEVPEQGPCRYLQAELIRIEWRFLTMLQQGQSYDLRLHEQMFLTLYRSVDALEGISSLSRQILCALLRWEQLAMRSGKDRPVDDGDVRGLSFGLVVEACLHHLSTPVEFEPNYL
jgi:hypothetical protein